MIEKFPVSLFGEDRLIRVYLPVGYQSDTKGYPVLYMHDGQNVLNDADAIGGTSLGLENYLDENRLEVIVVAIDQKSTERVNEYCPWVNGEYSKKILGQNHVSGGKGKQYIDFIVDELKPLIDNKYRTLKNHTAMAGISLGGLITVYAAYAYPDIFKNVYAFSSGFYRNQEEIEKLASVSDLSSLESFYLDCGTEEVVNDRLLSSEFLASNLAVYENLKKRMPNARFEAIEGANHNYQCFKERATIVFTHLKEV